jgi:flavin reductase (DIM6/NTAB) family NADH-FMN oxidoreductase RutF
MIFDLSQASTNQTYNLLIGLVAPRPIAWITSIDRAGKINAAPFSAYNYVGIDPPIVAIGVGNRSGPGVVGKDTAQNIRNTREFVINVVNETMAEAMVTCAIDFPPEVNELEIAQVETEASSVVAVPRIKEAPASLECREITTMEIGRSRVILGQVVAIHVKDEFVDPAGPYIRAEELHAIGRMNGLGAYVKTQDSFFQVPRLTYAQWLKSKNRARRSSLRARGSRPLES